MNSTVIWNAEPTEIRVMAAAPTRPFGVSAVNIEGEYMRVCPNAQLPTPPASPLYIFFKAAAL